MTTPYAMPQVVARARRCLLRRDPDLVHRLGTIADERGFTFRLSQFRADAVMEDDVALAKLEDQVNRLADGYKVDVRVVGPDGSAIYWRMTK
jgi:hypothetical protein